MFFSDRSGGTLLTSDKKISETTLKEISKFLLANGSQHGLNTERVRELQEEGLSRTQLIFGKNLIRSNSHSNIIVVENELNRCENGTIRVAMERVFSEKTRQKVKFKVNDVSALLNMEAGVQQKVITVSKSAFDTLEKYIEMFKFDEQYRFINQGENQSLLHRDEGRCQQITKCIDEGCCHLLKCCKSVCGLACLGIAGSIYYFIFGQKTD